MYSNNTCVNIGKDGIGTISTTTRQKLTNNKRALSQCFIGFPYYSVKLYLFSLKGFLQRNVYFETFYSWMTSRRSPKMHVLDPTMMVKKIKTIISFRNHER